MPKSNSEELISTDLDSSKIEELDNESKAFFTELSIKYNLTAEEIISTISSEENSELSSQDLKEFLEDFDVWTNTKGEEYDVSPSTISTYIKKSAKEDVSDSDKDLDSKAIDDDTLDDIGLDMGDLDKEEKEEVEVEESTSVGDVAPFSAPLVRNRKKIIKSISETFCNKAKKLYEKEKDELGKEKYNSVLVHWGKFLDNMGKKYNLTPTNIIDIIEAESVDAKEEKVIKDVFIQEVSKFSEANDITEKEYLKVVRDLYAKL